MLAAGPAKKVSIYIGEDHTYHGHPAYAAILEYLFNRGVSGASVIRGIAGFGADHHLHTITIERLTENLPIKIQFIESENVVNGLLLELHKMVGTGLIEIEDTVVKKPSQRMRVKPPYEGSLKRTGTARLMRICINEHDMWKGRPLYQALVECLRANGIAGVTVYQGWLGTDNHPHTRVGQFFHPTQSRPMTVSVIDDESMLRAIIPVLEKIISEGILALSDVEVIKHIHDFRSAERRKKPRTD